MENVSCPAGHWHLGGGGGLIPPYPPDMMAEIGTVNPMSGKKSRKKTTLHLLLDVFLIYMDHPTDHVCLVLDFKW